VLIAEDSEVTREYLAYLLGKDPELDIVGMAKDGQEAVEQAERLKPDLILMDVHMPRLDGIEATRVIMERVPTPIVMASVSSFGGSTAQIFDALKAGALTVASKPSGPSDKNFEESVEKLLQTIKAMAEVKVIRRWPKRERPPLPAQPPNHSLSQPNRKIRLIAIGASTGGPQAITEILSGLAGDLSTPVLVVQHIATGFISGFVEWLGQSTGLPVKLAEPDEPAMPGIVYLAPDGMQMGIRRDGRIHLTHEPMENGFSPSASYLMRSVAENYGRAAIGILLTGMGRDGADGLKQLRDAGAMTVAQDEESSVIFGMPREAIRLGAAEQVLPLTRISSLLSALAASPRSGKGGATPT
jgi:two-component system chemotaxis response regulator CheB